MVSVINEAFAIEDFLEGTRTNAGNIAELMDKGVFLVAEEESGRIIASIYVELRGPRGYFGMLAVAPSCQGLKLGRLMIEAAEEYCRVRGCQFMDITVLSLRTELPPFYRKHGYVETGTDEFHTSQPLKPGAECHCILMSKALQQ